ERADQARGGGDVDDAPASVGGQVRQRRLRAVEGAHDVDVEQPPHGFCGGVGEHGGSGDAGVVDDDVHGAAGEGGGAFGGLARGGPVGDVEGEAVRHTAVAGDLLG